MTFGLCSNNSPLNEQPTEAPPIAHNITELAAFHQIFTAPSRAPPIHLKLCWQTGVWEVEIHEYARCFLRFLVPGLSRRFPGTAATSSLLEIWVAKEPILPGQIFDAKASRDRSLYV